MQKCLLTSSLTVLKFHKVSLFSLKGVHKFHSSRIKFILCYGKKNSHVSQFCWPHSQFPLYAYAPLFIIWPLSAVNNLKCMHAIHKSVKDENYFNICISFIFYSNILKSENFSLMMSRICKYLFQFKIITSSWENWRVFIFTWNCIMNVDSMSIQIYHSFFKTMKKIMQKYLCVDSMSIEYENLFDFKSYCSRKFH